MKITDDSIARCRNAEQDNFEEAALQRNVTEPSKEFVVAGAKVYTKA